MQIYRVGGAVRDHLLGLTVRDTDWVVVGATPQMLQAQGFRPVGRDFPVFLHPDTREEYALARTERKSGRGYRGFVTEFSPDVTLEDDLRRRDLTINAIAVDEDGHYVDPWNGRRDLENRVLRHVSEAFAEDPVRILRVARFAARFHDFTIAPETMHLMKAMVAAGEADHLVAERVWQELARGLMESHPSRMLAVLRETGALARLLPELDRQGSSEAAGHPVRQPTPTPTPTSTLGQLLDISAAAQAALPVRFAVLMHGLGPDQIETLAARLRVPGECRDAALMTRIVLDASATRRQREAAELVALVERLDGLRRPARMHEAMLAARLLGAEPSAIERIAIAARAASGIDAGAIARAGSRETIQQRVRQARTLAVDKALAQPA